MARFRKPLSNIVSKCLERDPKLRYQSAAELLHDLDAYSGKGAAANLRFQPAVEPWGRTTHWPLVAGIVTVLVLAIVAYVFRGPLFSPAAQKRPQCRPCRWLSFRFKTPLATPPGTGSGPVWRTC